VIHKSYTRERRRSNKRSGTRSFSQGPTVLTYVRRSRFEDQTLPSHRLRRAVEAHTLAKKA
jgi:hypothetical protein